MEPRLVQRKYLLQVSDGLPVTCPEDLEEFRAGAGRAGRAGRPGGLAGRTRQDSARLKALGLLEGQMRNSFLLLLFYGFENM